MAFMDVNYFKKKIAHLLGGYNLKYTSFKDGDFGDLERVEIDGFHKLATVDLWSKGWVNIDVYDCNLEIQLMNLLLDSSEEKEQGEAMEALLGILLTNE